MDVIFWQRQDGELVEMRPKTYDREDVLQQLLAEHPHLLVAGRDDVRLLLIAREQGVPDYMGAHDRWSLDHLFVDSRGVPTLVEVKRASDTRIRREVVAQMLDYAANGVRYWPEGSMRSQFERTAGGLESAAEIFADFLPDGDMPEFWDLVENNLRAGELRLVFVADQIPDSLRRIIEFLNEQMDRTEVIGVEVQQYVGGGQVSFVPQVLGRTTAAQRIKPKTGSYAEDVASGDKIVREASALLDKWAADSGVETRLTRRAKQFLDPAGDYLFQFYPMYGSIEVPIQSFIGAGRPDLHERVRGAFQSLTQSRLSHKHLQLPARDLVSNWKDFTGVAVPILVEARRELHSN